MSKNRLLLKEGIILQHDQRNNVAILRDTDLLIEGDRISKISKSIQVPNDTTIIDCKNKIICPGLIDTHHHVWQTQLKGRHSDDNLLDYTFKGNMQCYNYTPSDVFYGELGGLLESLDEGTTCIVDHAHMTYSPDHVSAGLSATISSGIRSIFCYSHMPRFKVWSKTQIEPEDEFLPDWMMSQLEDLTKRQPFGNDGRVEIGFAFDAITAPKDTVISLYEKVRRFGVKLITSHWRSCNLAGATHTIPSILDSYGLLGPDILLSHATGTTDEDFSRLKQAGSFVSCTPATEAQMGHGEVVGFRHDVNGSLGADCHSNNSASILHAACQGLAAARSHRNQRLIEAGKFPSKIQPTTLQAFNLATIDGAHAVGMGDELGSLQEGKLADIVIFDTDSPAMLVAAEHDPVAAVIRHASAREINTVLVGGVVRKGEGKLVDVRIDDQFLDWVSRDESVKSILQNGSLSWADVAKGLLKSRAEIEVRNQHCGFGLASKKILEMWMTPEGIFVD